MEKDSGGRGDTFVKMYIGMSKLKSSPVSFNTLGFIHETQAEQIYVWIIHRNILKLLISGLSII